MIDPLEPDAAHHDDIDPVLLWQTPIVDVFIDPFENQLIRGAFYQYHLPGERNTQRVVAWQPLQRLYHPLVQEMQSLVCVMQQADFICAQFVKHIRTVGGQNSCLPSRWSPMSCTNLLSSTCDR